MSFATLVLIDDATAESLVAFVATAMGEETGPAFSETCLKMIKDGKGVQLVDEILSKSSVILALEDDSAVEGYFRALITVMLRIGEDRCSAAVASIVQRLTATKTGNRCTLSLRLLLVLFNLLSKDATKYTTILDIVLFACDTNQANSVIGFHPLLLDWSGSWSLSSGQKRTLFLVIRKALQAATASTSAADARKYFLHYLSTYPADQALSKDALDTTIAATLEFIHTPVAAFSERSALLSALTTQMVGNAEPLQQLRALLNVLCQGSLADYRAYAANPSNIQALAKLETRKVDFDELLTNMRLLSLCTAATNLETMTYAQAAGALDVSADEVEVWIVTAIASGVIEANLNQAKSTMVITRCGYRHFGPEQWKDVQAKLKLLRANVSSVYDDMIRARRGL